MSAKPAPKKRKSKEANPLPWVLLVIALLVGAIWFVSRGSKPGAKPKADDTLTITVFTPPPPPPPKVEPPPPKEEPPKDEELVEEEPIDVNEPPPEAPAPDPGPDLGTNITNGNGPDMGLTRGGGNGRIGGGSKGGRGSVFNRYALRAKNTIEQALRNDPVTRKAIINGLKIEFWPASDGSILRAKVIGGSGNSEIDLAVKRVLTGLQTEPAPTAAEMPPSVRIRITARKPVI